MFPTANFRRAAGLALWVAGLLASVLPGVQSAQANGDEFSGTNLLTGAVALPTGSGSALTRTNLVWSAPTNLSHPALVFVAGFATQERFAPGKFFDSLTVVVRDADNTFVAPILTVDASGTIVAPENPGGAQLAPSAIEAEMLEAPPISGVYTSRQACLVMAVLPPELIGKSGSLRLGLFDNQDTEASLGFVSHLNVVPGPGTFLTLESAAAVEGPYAREQVSVRHARRRLTLPHAGIHRFYQLQSDSSTRITEFQLIGGHWQFRYTGGDAAVPPVLVSSAQAAGPYAAETGVVADANGRTLRLPQRGAARFFRLHAELPLTIRQLFFEGDHAVFRYE